MLLRLAQTLEQLDLALEHLAIGDPNNARFGLMLTDNALEISLHRLAQDHAYRLRPSGWMAQKEYEHAAALERALGQDFGAKVKFAKALGLVKDREADTIATGHTFRNETYHVGVQHEEVLPQIADFYFKVVCTVLARYEPQSIGWSSGQRLPERARKYFRDDGFLPGSIAAWQAGCLTLAQASDHTDAGLIAALFAHMAEVIDDADRSLHFLANDGPKQVPRAELIVDIQAWPIAFSEAGKAYLRDHGAPRGNAFRHVEWIAANYPFDVRRDPIPGWRKRVSALRRDSDPHVGLRRYRSFIDQTREFRGWLDEAAAGLDAEIQRQVDMMRGK